jgi:hypothetical protein
MNNKKYCKICPLFSFFVGCQKQHDNSSNAKSMNDETAENSATAGTSRVIGTPTTVETLGGNRSNVNNIRTPASNSRNANISAKTAGTAAISGTHTRKETVLETPESEGAKTN